MAAQDKDLMLQVSDDQQVLICRGRWTLATLELLETELKILNRHPQPIKEIDASRIAYLDSAGVLFLQDLFLSMQQKNSSVTLTGLAEKYQPLLQFVQSEAAEIQKPFLPLKSYRVLYRIGIWAVDKYEQITQFLNFMGELAYHIMLSMLQPRRIQWRSIIAAIEINGYQALPIVGLMAFLIGMVLAYQLAVELRIYGADIYVVDATGISILREFGPLITSVIVAGRTSTSFAALIGTMKVGEEIDALNTMGLSPVERLVMPRIAGLILALPLLAIWADIFGVFGSMLMAQDSLHIGFYAYLDRFVYAVGLKNYILGLVKVPVFALIIAAVGCFQGFQVSMNAESVGQKTTKAAVQSIFLIIIADAAFSVLFSKMGW